MYTKHASSFLVHFLVIIVSVLSLEDIPSSDPKDNAFRLKGNAEGKQRISMKVDLPLLKTAASADSYKAMIGEAQKILKGSKNICGGKNQGRHAKRRLLLADADAVATAPLSLSNSPSPELLRQIFTVKEALPADSRFKKDNKISWLIFQNRKHVMDLFVSGGGCLDASTDDKFAVTIISADNKFRAGVYGEEVYRPGSLDKVMSGTVFRISEASNMYQEGGTFNIVYISFDTSTVPPTGKKLFGNLFWARDVVPNHVNFTNNLKYLNLPGLNCPHEMDILFDPKDVHYQMHPNDKYAITIRDDYAFSAEPFKAGSYDFVINATMYLLESSAFVDNVMYATFGDSFFKLRVVDTILTNFIECSNIYVLFQKLSFQDIEL